MTQRAKKVYGVGLTKKGIPLAAIMFTVFGVVFFGWGIYNSLGTKSIDWFPLVMGAAFLGMGVFVYFRVKGSD